MDQAAPDSRRYRRSSRLAWALTGVLCVLALVDLVVGAPVVLADKSVIKIAAALMWSILPIVFAVVAALITSRQPRNRIGWLLMVPAVVLLLGRRIDLLLGMSTTAPAPTVPNLLATWFQSWSWLLLIFPLLMILLIFPTGKPPSPRWRWVQRYALLLFVVFVAFASLGRNLHQQNDLWALPNPIGVIPDAPAVTTFFVMPWIANLALLTILCAASLFARYRHAAAVERQQIKWLLLAGAVFAIFYVPLLLTQGDSLLGVPGLGDLVLTVTATLFPIAIAIGILRYRLWDIDVIINRALVYVPLTAIVAGIFSAAISVSQKAFVAVTGQDSTASAVIATLIVVALFNPIKDRVQHFVDKRFKEVPSPNKRLNAFQERLGSRVSEVGVAPITRRFLEEAVAAFDAEGGIAYLDEQGSLKQIYTAGEWKGEERMSVSVECSGARIACVALGTRRHGRDYADLDRKTLESVAQVVGQAIEEDGSLQRWHGAARPCG